MEIRYSSNFDKKLENLAKKRPEILKKVDQKLKMLLMDRRHPSLRLHKIGSKHDSWSVSVDMGLRVLFIYKEYGILMVDIGSHDEVY